MLETLSNYSTKDKSSFRAISRTRTNQQNWTTLTVPKLQIPTHAGDSKVRCISTSFRITLRLIMLA